MRKMIWCGTALLICGTVAVFCAARHAAENPDTVLGRCATAAYSLAVRCNAIGILGQLSNQEQVAAGPGKPIPGAALPIPAPEVAGDEHQEPPLADEEQGGETVEPIVVDAPEDTPMPERAVPQSAPAQTDPEEDVTAERDFDRLPKVMPYADDDHRTAAELGMAADCCMGQFFSWLLNGDKACENKTSCPACCQNLIKSIADYVAALFEEENETAEEAEVPPAPEPVPPMSSEEPQESGAGRGAFREDPYYHHQYPSCPYTGGCPYPHSYTVPHVLPTETTPTPAPTQTPTEPMKHMSFKITPPGTPHPEVDTMECRPTDVPEADSDETY